ncbi:MAG: carboxypeptidase regulatory-like domain-containing protein [Gemmatimonadaceae bacterium]
MDKKREVVGNIQRQHMFRNSLSAFSFAVVASVVAVPAVLHSQVTTRAPGSPAPPAATAIVRGTVFDSLTMEPVAKASVWLPGGSQTTSADDRGKFELDGVPVGRQFIAFSSPALDSLGLGTLGALVEVSSSGTPAQLTTPSFRTIWRSLCANVLPATRIDSGIVWGTVRDANSDTRLSGASAGFRWYDMSLSTDKRVGFREVSHQVRTDSTGNYYACGLPSELKIASEATGARSASGTVEYVIGARRLYRVDMLVSTDMVLQKNIAGTTASDSARAMRPHGTSTLRGTVRDGKGVPVVGANVILASVDTSARTNAAGEFTFTRLPAGSHSIQARQVGFGPATMFVELRPSQTTSVTVEMPSARTLAAVNVKADRPMGPDQQEFEYRKKTGMGYILTEKDIGTRPDMASMLIGLPGVTVQRSPGTVIINISDRKGGVCTPVPYVDGISVSPDQINIYNPEDFRAVELYYQATIPTGFQWNNCGIVLFWTKRNPRWNK